MTAAAGTADRLRVLGRDDTVVTGGATVVLADVEAALRPGLRGEVAVVGLPHPELGAVVVAVLTDDGGLGRRPDRARTLGAGRPRAVAPPVRSCPLTPAGKVDRPALVAELTAVARQEPPMTARPVIVAARRTPIGRAGGALSTVDRGRAGRSGAGRRAPTRQQPDRRRTAVAEVVLGNCMGPGGDVARVAALAAGLRASASRR